MIFHELKLTGAFLVEPERRSDERGFFAQTWSVPEFQAKGLNPKLVLCAISYNHRKGTLRGMHLQMPPFAQAKLVRCTRGSIHDVIVDLRAGSPTERQWLSVALSADNRLQLYVPEGFAHGFQTLEDDTEIHYQMSEAYQPASEQGFRWNDPAFAIEWPPGDRIISERDRRFPGLAAPGVLKSKIFRDTLWLNASTIVARGFTFVQTLLLMRILNPEAYGVWLGLGVLLTYSNYAGLGLEYGMGTRLPYYLGKNEQERAGQSADTVYLAWTLIALLFAAGVLAFAFLFPQPSGAVRLGLAISAALVLLQQQSMFLTRWQVSALKDFRLYSIISGVSSVAGFAAIVPLAWTFGIPGAMGGLLFSSALTFGLWKLKSEYRPRWRFSGAVLREMLGVGFPILLVVLGGMLIETVDRILILQMLGASSLGIYGMAVFAASIVYVLLSQAGSAMGPHIAEEMGRSEGHAPALEKFLVKPTLLFAYVSAAAIMGLTFVLPPLVEALLPKYLAGLPAFRAFAPGYFFLSMILAANGILNMVLIARQRQRWVVYIQAVVILVEVGLTLWFIRLGWDILGVAVASTAACALYGLLILALTAHYVLPERRRFWRFLLDVMTPCLYAAAVTGLLLYAGERWIGGGALRRTLVQVGGSAIACVPMIWMLHRRSGLLSGILPLFKGSPREPGSV